MIVRTTVKSIQDIMRQDVGVDGDAQRISQLTWMFFLKIIDDQDQELELTRDGYRSPIPRIWVLTIVDTWSRICPVMRVCRSATAMVVIEALDEARHTFGLPHTIRVDQGCQFTSKELDLWAYTRGITLDFSRLGKPTDNAGGIRPSARRRGRETLSLFEREEISRGLSTQCSLRSIARQLGRSASTISREVSRNGGLDRYRAARSDQAAWDRALRPKLCNTNGPKL